MLWDYAERRHMMVQNYVIAQYVCTSEKHYPLELRRLRKREEGLMQCRSGKS